MFFYCCHTYKDNKDSYVIVFKNKKIEISKSDQEKITYEVTKGRYKEGTFTGVATFLSSQTGETHDEPFIITYKTRTNIFSETNGTYKCN